MILSMKYLDRVIKIDTSKLAEAILAEMEATAEGELFKDKSTTLALLALLKGIDQVKLSELFDSYATYMHEEYMRGRTGTSVLCEDIGGQIQKSFRQVGISDGNGVNTAIWHLMHACKSWWQAWRVVFAGYSDCDVKVYVK